MIGLSPRLAEADTLRKNEYFGKYGKIYKVVINNSTVYSGAQVWGDERLGQDKGKGERLE